MKCTVLDWWIWQLAGLYRQVDKSVQCLAAANLSVQRSCQHAFWSCRYSRWKLAETGNTRTHSAARVGRQYASTCSCSEVMKLSEEEVYSFCCRTILVCRNRYASVDGPRQVVTGHTNCHLFMVLMPARLVSVKPAVTRERCLFSGFQGM